MSDVDVAKNSVDVAVSNSEEVRQFIPITIKASQMPSSTSLV